MVLPMPGSSKCLLLQPLPEINFIISTLHFSNWQTVCWVIFTHCRAGHPGLHGDLLRDHLHPAHAPAVRGAGQPLLTDFWIDKTKVDAVVPTLMDAFNLPDDIRSFMFDQYLPEVGSNCPPKKIICWIPQIRLATAEINLGVLEKGQFQLNTVGTLVKLIYAFLWQVGCGSIAAFQNCTNIFFCSTDCSYFFIISSYQFPHS